MPKYFEFEVTVWGIRPRIWRRFLLPATATFRHLHDAIQDASGSWMDYHLHVFRMPGREGVELCGTPPEADDILVDDVPTPDSRKVGLGAWFPKTLPPGPRPACLYEYDFGDGWEVDVLLRRVVEIPEKFRRRLVAGERRFPPDDCGGTWGYEKCCRALAWAAGGTMPQDANPEDWTDRLEWVGRWRPDDWVPQVERTVFEAGTGKARHPR